MVEGISARERHTYPDIDQASRDGLDYHAQHLISIALAFLDNAVDTKSTH